MGNQSDTIIRQFGALARKHFHPCTVILFGSRAGKKFRKDSDYDFLLISPRFKQWEWEQRLAKAYRMKKDIPAAMDILCLTPEELERKRKGIGVIQEALREGIKV